MSTDGSPCDNLDVPELSSHGDHDSDNGSALSGDEPCADLAVSGRRPTERLDSALRPAFCGETDLGYSQTRSEESGESSYIDSDDVEEEEDEEDEEEEEEEEGLDDLVLEEPTPRRRVWLFLDDPGGWLKTEHLQHGRWGHTLSTRWGPAALLVSTTTFCAIVASCITLVLESMPVHRGDRHSSPWFAMETAFVVYFTVEYLTRLWACPDRLHFLMQALNAIDLLSILPYYVDLASKGFPVDLRTLRLVRVIRVFRVLRISPSMEENTDSVLRTFSKSKEVLLLYLCVLIITVIVWSSAVYYIERVENTRWDSQLELLVRHRRDRGDSRGYEFIEEVSPFQSIFHCLWWCLATVTTTGFGDDTPESIGGRLVASCAMLSGLFVLALPTSILGSNFLRVYNEKARRTSSKSGQSEALKAVSDGVWRMDEFLDFVDTLAEDRQLLSCRDAEYLRRALWCESYQHRVALAFEVSMTYHAPLRERLEQQLRHIGVFKPDEERHRHGKYKCAGKVECAEARGRYHGDVHLLDDKALPGLTEGAVLDFLVRRACYHCGRFEASLDGVRDFSKNLCTCIRPDRWVRSLPVAVDVHYVKVDYHQLLERWNQCRRIAIGQRQPVGALSMWLLANSWELYTAVAPPGPSPGPASPVLPDPALPARQTSVQSAITPQTTAVIPGRTSASYHRQPVGPLTFGDPPPGSAAVFDSLLSTAPQLLPAPASAAAAAAAPPGAAAAAAASLAAAVVTAGEGGAGRGGGGQRRGLPALVVPGPAPDSGAVAPLGLASPFNRSVYVRSPGPCGDMHSPKFGPSMRSSTTATGLQQTVPIGSIPGLASTFGHRSSSTRSGGEGTSNELTVTCARTIPVMTPENSPDGSGSGQEAVQPFRAPPVRQIGPTGHTVVRSPLSPGMSPGGQSRTTPMNSCGTGTEPTGPLSPLHFRIAAAGHEPAPLSDEALDTGQGSPEDFRAEARLPHPIVTPAVARPDKQGNQVPVEPPPWTTSLEARDRKRRTQQAAAVQLWQLEEERGVRFLALARFVLEHIRRLENEARMEQRMERERIAASRVRSPASGSSAGSAVALSPVRQTSSEAAQITEGDGDGQRYPHRRPPGSPLRIPSGQQP
eukprot:TRINITY_DN5111_c1_g2_i1.p1 TRINITY_DN5111_c1_g2~~TRINITY_DN5111_c1_g2_i1.p1  ORF type:complete len:1161 (+),score=224.65 TRINITY_DN5111_c1_g2_i1:145-3483(+)